MEHHNKDIGMILNNVDLTQVDLNVDKGRKVVTYLIAKLQ